MQEKTLEQFVEENKYGWTDEDGDGNYHYNPNWDEVAKFISSREEKAREEGRKEGFIDGADWVNAKGEHTNYFASLLQNERERGGRELITQYKEELLGKLPEEREDILIEGNFNECLSSVKKLINTEKKPLNELLPDLFPDK